MKNTEIIYLILKLRLKRAFNRYSAVLNFWKKKNKQPEKREATVRKKRGKPIGMILILIYMIFSVFSLCFATVFNMGEFLSKESFYCALIFMFWMLFISSIITETPNASGTSITSTFDVEWLLSFPLRLKVIYYLKLIEFSVFNVIGWAAFFPLQVAFFWFEGFRWTAPLIAFIFTCFINIVIGIFKLLKETALRKLFKQHSQIQFIKSILFVIGTLLLFFAFSISNNRNPDSLFFKISVSSLSQFFYLFPSSISVITAKHFSNYFYIIILSILSGIELCVFIYFTGAAVTSVIGKGDIFEGNLTGFRGKDRANKTEIIKGFGFFGREFRKLIREPLYAAQLFVIPLLIFFIYIYNLSSNKGNIQVTMSNSPFSIGLFAYFGGAYLLITSIVSILASENPSAWVLFTFPKKIFLMLKEKIYFFMSFSIFFCLIILIFGIFKNGIFTLRMFFVALFAIAGIPVMAFMGAGLAILGTDLFEKEKNKQVSPGQVYLLMFLMSIYASGFFTGSLWIQSVVFVLCFVFAYATWDKAKDHLPYILDPEMAPKPSITLSDALFSALLFFALQNLAFIPLIFGFKADKVLFFSYNLAGSITVLTVFLNFRRRKIKDILQKIGLKTAPLIKIIAPVVLLSSIAFLFAMIYLYFAPQIPYLKDVINRINNKDNFTGIFGLLLVVLAAPVFEEFIFRGLIFKSFRQKSGFIFSAAASAVIFGMIHPQAGVIPVTMLGFCAAWALESSGTLIAPICVHFIYNLLIVLVNNV